MPPRVLLISHDIVGDAMAGPGIRYLTLARVLARRVPLTFAIPNLVPPSLAREPFPVHTYARRAWASLEALARESDVIVFNTDIASDFPELAALPASLVVDAYDPMLAEGLAMMANAPMDQQMAWWRARHADLRAQWQVGDFFICASERQRDWCLGVLEHAGRINPRAVAQDPSLRRLVDVVTYGVDDDISGRDAARNVLRGVWPGIGGDDRLVLWGGGLWPWLDPLTAIHAMAVVARVRDDARLVFPGTRHPNPDVAGMPTHAGAARALAADLGLAGRTVLFGDWVPYADWPAVLRECDLALSLHHNTYETRLAFRSRTMGYVWAGLPVVASRGDATGDLIAAYGLGELVEPGDAGAVAGAILRLLDTRRETFASAFARARHDYAWERAAAPLIRFCEAPWRAADRQA